MINQPLLDSLSGSGTPVYIVRGDSPEVDYSIIDSLYNNKGERVLLYRIISRETQGRTE